MAVTTITRATAALVDDDGTGTTGTVFNDAWYQLLCDAVDAILSSALELGGTLKVNGALTPVTTNTGALGSATLMWEDLFLASGGVINFNNGDVTVTHSANALAFAGASSGYSFDALIDALGGQVGFPATQAASAGANVLDDYEEGTWTPTDASGATLTLSTATGQYVKVGQFVYASFVVVYPATADATAMKIGSLPFTAQSVNGQGGAVSYTNYGTAITLNLPSGTTTVVAYKFDGTVPTNANLSEKTITGAVLYRASA